VPPHRGLSRSASRTVAPDTSSTGRSDRRLRVRGRRRQHDQRENQKARNHHADKCVRHGWGFSSSATTRPHRRLSTTRLNTSHSTRGQATSGSSCEGLVRGLAAERVAGILPISSWKASSARSSPFSSPLSSSRSLCGCSFGTCPGSRKTRSHLINPAAGCSSRRGAASPGSSLSDARNARQSAESSGTKQTVARPSTSVRSDAAGDRLPSAASESSDAERSAPRPGVPIPRPVCLTLRRYRQCDGLEAA
jgi:hypothetical protein